MLTCWHVTAGKVQVLIMKSMMDDGRFKCLPWKRPADRDVRVFNVCQILTVYSATRISCGWTLLRGWLASVTCYNIFSGHHLKNYTWLLLYITISSLKIYILNNLLSIRVTEYLQKHSVLSWKPRDALILKTTMELLQDWGFVTLSSFKFYINISSSRWQETTELFHVTFCF